MKIFCKVLFLYLSIVLTACSSVPPLDRGQHSMQAVVYNTASSFLSGSMNTLEGELIDRDTFIRSVHPHTPEANQARGPVSGEDKWNIFIKPKRDNAIRNKMKLYANKGYKFEGFEDSGRVLQFGELKLHRRIRVKFSGPDGKSLIDDGIVGVVAEKNNRFVLLNVFND